MPNKKKEKKNPVVKILKYVVITLLAIIVGLVAIGAFLYFMYLKPVSSQKICQKLFDLSRIEVSNKLGKEVQISDIEKQLGMTVSECAELEKVSRKKSYLGLIKITKKSRCELKAQDITDFRDCYNQAKGR